MSDVDSPVAGTVPPKRRGPIRWAGLGAFVVIVGGLFGGGWLFADTLARWSLQSTLSRIQGAEVNIEAVDIGWQPFGLTLSGLAITDPAAPETNALAAERIDARLDFLALLTGKVTIDTLDAVGVATGTERSSPGWVRQRAAPATETSGTQEPSIADRLSDTVTLPDSDTALSAIQPLTIQSRATEAGQARERVSESLAQTRDRLPGENTVNGYQQRVQTLRNTTIDGLDDVQRLRNEVADLRQSVQADRTTLRSGLATIRAGEAELRAALDALQRAPADDLSRLRARYNLTPEGQLALAEVLLGPQWADWLETGQRWYGRAEPWLDRVADWRDDRAAARAAEGAPVGRFVTFPEADLRPRFWLRRAAIEWRSEAGTWDAQLTDLSSNQRLIDRATELRARSDRLDRADEGLVTVIWDRRGNQPRTNIDFSLTGWNLRGWSLGGDGLNVNLARATTTLNLVASRSNQWDGQLNWQFRDTRFDSALGGDGPQALLADALASINRFRVDARLSGNNLVPRTQWSSDLGSQVGSSIRAAVQARYQAWENDIRAELNGRVDALAQPVRAQVDEARAQADAVQQRIAQLETQVLNELDRLEARIEQERQALERAAQERLQQERQRLENRAREQLRNFDF